MSFGSFRTSIIGETFAVGGGGGSSSGPTINQLAAKYGGSQSLVVKLDPRTDPHILGLSNGAAVVPWTEPVSGYTFVAPYTGGSPTLNTTIWSDGGSAISFVEGGSFNTGQALECDALAVLGSLGATFSLVLRFRTLTTTTAQIVEGLSVSSTTPYRYAGLDGSACSPEMVCTAGTPATTQPQSTQGSYTTAFAQNFLTEDSLMVIDCAGTQSQAWVNGQNLPLYMPGDSATTYTKYILGGLNYNAQLHPSSLDGYVRYAAIYSNALGRKGHAAVVYNMSMQHQMRCYTMAEGDSITAGLGAGTSWFTQLSMGTTDVIPSPLSSSMVIGPHITQSAQSGRTLVNQATYQNGNCGMQHILADLQTGYNPALASVCFIFLGHNDVYYGGGTITGAQVYNNLLTLIALVRSSAPDTYLVVCTPLQGANSAQNWSTSPNYGGSTAPYQQALSDYRNAILAGAASAGIDQVVDFWSCPGVTYQADNVHPDAAGQGVMSAFVPWLTNTAGGTAIRLNAVNKWLYLQMIGN